MARRLHRLVLLRARRRRGLLPPPPVTVNSELALIVAEAFKRIEELTQKKAFVANAINTSNSETDLEKETITKVAEQVGISLPALSEVFESRVE